MEELLRELRVEERELSVEINGGVFFMCVYRVFKGLERETLINPQINYDCTDSVPNYWILKRSLDSGNTHSYITFDGVKMQHPVPTPEVYERYKQHLKEFPESS